MRIFLGTAAHNQHVQNIARAFYERGMLGEYHTGGVDVWPSKWARKARAAAERVYPRLGSALARRRIPNIPERLISTSWGWEACRLASQHLGSGEVFEDWLWEKSEHSLDRYCASRIGNNECDAFMGVEHGALRALTRARNLGKPGVVAFLSPHHAARERWVDSEYERFPELLTPATKSLLEKARSRDRRRDEEARLADVIHCASRFTRDSLVAAGIPGHKIIVAPLGCPQVTSINQKESARSGGVRFMYSGPVSVRKGAHVLIEAWKRLRPGATAELHFFGVVTLPSRFTSDAGPGVFFHGPVGPEQIAQEYRSSSVLVFPTLFDGFGMVVAEAFSHGLPVITTPNAGSADMVKEGENGWLVAAKDADALAERLQFCMSHPNVLAQMRGSAIDTARQWTWWRFRESFIAQISRLLPPVDAWTRTAMAAAR